MNPQSNVRPLHANRDVSQELQRPRQQAQGGQATFQAKGHDKTLQDAQFSHREMVLETIDGQEVTGGRLVRRDRYTLTLRFAAGDEVVYFKHAIKSFEVVSPAPLTFPKIDESTQFGEAGQ